MPPTSPPTHTFKEGITSNQNRDRNTKIREKLASSNNRFATPSEGGRYGQRWVWERECHRNLPREAAPLPGPSRSIQDLHSLHPVPPHQRLPHNFLHWAKHAQLRHSQAIPRRSAHPSHPHVPRPTFLRAAQEGMDFEHVKFVTLDQLTLKYFAYELVRQLDEQRIPELFQKRIESFMHFITTNEVPCNEVYLLSTGLTSEQDQWIYICFN